MRGALAWHQGDLFSSAEMFAESDSLLRGVEMHHVVAAVQHARARIVGGLEADWLNESMREYTKAHGIVRPEAFFRTMLVVPMA